MTPDHPLCVAARNYLRVVAEECTAAAEKAEGNVVLRHREHLRLSTNFSGMGGAEMSSYFAMRSSGLEIRSISQCDIVPEALNEACSCFRQDILDLHFCQSWLCSLIFWMQLIDTLFSLYIYIYICRVYVYIYI